jgi:hypothetical protein
METIEDLTSRILQELPEISDYTIAPWLVVEDDITTIYNQHGKVLFRGKDRLELEREYQMFVHAKFPDYIPF